MAVKKAASPTQQWERVAVAALEDIKAQDITVLDVRNLTSLYDTLIIASAGSARQTKALANHVRERLKEAGAEIIGVEGEEGGEWVLVDCGDVVVHVMQPAVRAYYNLEELWTPPAPIRPRKKIDALEAEVKELKKAPARKTAAKKMTDGAKPVTARKTPAKKATKVASTVAKPRKRVSKKTTV